MERYTLGLALFDYLPVIAAAIGLYLICRYCSLVGRQQGAWIIMVPLVAVTGGFLKATWKLIVVVTGVNIQWMSDQLFFFIASGYLLMASLVVMSLRAHGRNEQLAATWWRAPLIAVVVVVTVALALAFSVSSRSWAFLLLGVMSLANLVFSIRLIAHSIGQSKWLATLGFSLNLVLAYVLVGLARIPEQTLELQWAEEILNLAATSSLALAAWYMIRTSEQRRGLAQ